MELRSYSIKCKMGIPTKKTYEPFSATKLWNLHVKLFKNTISCKTHRRKIRSYSNCFTATEGITVMHEIMCTLSDKKFTKDQARMMIKKLLLFNVIEDVKGRSGSEQLEIDGELFRIKECDDAIETISLCSMAPKAGNTPSKHYMRLRQHIKNKMKSPVTNDNFFSPVEKLRRFSVNDSYKSQFRLSIKSKPSIANFNC